MPISILVADSNMEFGILIRQALEESGQFEVSLTSSAEEAVNLAQGLDFRLAIIDFALPDIEGEKLVERLRALQPGLAVIGIPVGDDDTSEKTRQAGVDGILTKPFYLPNLPDIVEEALGRRLDFHRPTQVAWPRTTPTPDVPDNSAAALPIDKSASFPSEDYPMPFDEPPPWLADVNRAAQYLARLTLETSAEAALLIRHRELIASAGQLPRGQLQELTAQVADSWAEEGRSGAVARFVHLPGTAEDFMLYATGVVAGMVLSLVFGAEVPFGMIRRQAESLAHALSEIDPALRPSKDTGSTSKSHPSEREPSPTRHKQSPAAEAAVQESHPSQAAVQPQTVPLRVESPLPEDWIPQPDQPSPSARLLDELASLELPEPDPAEGGLKMGQAESQPARHRTPDLPLDWLPMITHSKRHLPFLDDPEPVETDTCASPPQSASPSPSSSPGAETGISPTAAPETPAAPPGPVGVAQAVPELAVPAASPPHPAGPNSDPRLPFTVVLAPRFPEHRLAGPLVENLVQWTRRLCLAWDWKADRVDVTDDALVVQIMLPPEVAPAAAAQELSEHLSARIFQTFPHLEAGFPTGGFWASAHLLASGKSVSPAEVSAFVDQLRQAQGLSD